MRCPRANPRAIPARSFPPRRREQCGPPASSPAGAGSLPLSTLLQRWRQLAGVEADALGEALIRAWAEPQRHYHDQSHLTWLLDEADRRAALIHDYAFVGYAIWFHDAVYMPGRPDNETLSADWARGSLAHDPDLAHRVGH